MNDQRRDAGGSSHPSGSRKSTPGSFPAGQHAPVLLDQRPGKFLNIELDTALDGVSEVPAGRVRWGSQGVVQTPRRACTV
jgi:hypothetical protein